MCIYACIRFKSKIIITKSNVLAINELLFLLLWRNLVFPRLRMLLYFISVGCVCCALLFLMSLSALLEGSFHAFNFPFYILYNSMKWSARIFCASFSSNCMRIKRSIFLWFSVKRKTIYIMIIRNWFQDFYFGTQRPISISL